MLPLFVLSLLFIQSDAGILKRTSREWATECGVSKYSDAGSDGVDQALIINGWDARIHEFPWQANLQYRGSLTCGAVIINDRFVLTAAHCLDGGRTVEDITVRVGDHDFNNPTEDLVEFNSELFVLHESYDATGNLENDIALVKIADDIEPGSIPNYENITPACIPDKDYGGTYGSASGWGRLAQDGDLPTVLQYANNPIMDQDDCIECVGDATDLHPGKLCFGYCGQNNRSTCNGDSGGPLSVRQDDGTFDVIGLTSYGIGGCLTEYPKIFTNVTYYVPWIQDQLERYGD